MQCLRKLKKPRRRFRRNSSHRVSLQLLEALSSRRDAVFTCRLYSFSAVRCIRCLIIHDHVLGMRLHSICVREGSMGSAQKNPWA